MELETLKDDHKRIFESALDISPTLRLRAHEDVLQAMDEEERPSLIERFSMDLLSRIVECIEEL